MALPRRASIADLVVLEIGKNIGLALRIPFVHIPLVIASCFGAYDSVYFCLLISLPILHTTFVCYIQVRSLDNIWIGICECANLRGCLGEYYMYVPIHKPLNAELEHILMMETGHREYNNVIQ